MKCTGLEEHSEDSRPRTRVAFLTWCAKEKTKSKGEREGGREKGRGRPEVSQKKQSCEEKRNPAECRVC